MVMKGLTQFRKFLNERLSAPDKWFSRNDTVASKFMLIIAVGAIISWQLYFYNNTNLGTTPNIVESENIDKETILSCRDIKSRLKAAFRYIDTHPYVTASSGAYQPPVFTYGLYYWGLFPVYPVRSLLPKEFLSDDLFYSKKGADLIMEKYGNALRTEYEVNIRFGDLGRNYLPYFQALIKRSPKDVSFKFANSVFFIFSLLALFIVFWWHNRGLLGMLLVAFLGSYRPQLFEVYQNNNIFGYLITVTIMMSALFLPVIFDSALKKWMQVAICLISGALLAAFYSIRTEIIAIIFGLVFALIFYKRIRFIQRIWLIIFLLTAFFCAELAYGNYFEHKFKEASVVVSKKGGDAYSGNRMKHHPFWHSIWCGLGDFDGKYGYDWYDVTANNFVESRFREEYGEKIFGGIDTTSSAFVYYFHLLPEYEIFLRDKVIKDITKDPLWYAGILMKRCMTIAVYAAAYKLHFIGLSARFIYLGIPCLLVFILLLFIKRWEYIKLAIFSFSTASIAFFVYSGMGTPLYFTGHLYCLGITMYVLIKVLLHE